MRRKSSATDEGAEEEGERDYGRRTAGAQPLQHVRLLSLGANLRRRESLRAWGSAAGLPRTLRGPCGVDLMEMLG